MGDVFYSLGIFVFIGNLYNIWNFRRILKINEWMVKFKKVTRKEPSARDYRNKDDKKIISIWSLVVIFSSIWIILGLATKSWFIFLILININIIISLLRKGIGEFNKFSNLFLFIKLLITSAMVFLLVINHFHLHTDIWSLFNFR